MQRTRKLRAFFGALAACVVFSPLVTASNDESNVPQASTAVKAFSNNHYIVRLTENPVVAYEGDIAGYAATKPQRGNKIDPNDPNVARYVGFLDSRHSDVVARVGGRKVYDYRYSFNGSVTGSDAFAEVPSMAKNGPELGAHSDGNLQRRPHSLARTREGEK